MSKTSVSMELLAYDFILIEHIVSRMAVVPKAVVPWHIGDHLRKSNRHHQHSVLKITQNVSKLDMNDFAISVEKFVKLHYS